MSLTTGQQDFLARSQCPNLPVSWADKSARLWSGRLSLQPCEPRSGHRGRWVASPWHGCLPRGSVQQLADGCLVPGSQGI